MKNANQFSPKPPGPKAGQCRVQMGLRRLHVISKWLILTIKFDVIICYQYKMHWNWKKRQNSKTTRWDAGGVQKQIGRTMRPKSRSDDVTRISCGSQLVTCLLIVLGTPGPPGWISRLKANMTWQTEWPWSVPLRVAVERDCFMNAECL